MVSRIAPTVRGAAFMGACALTMVAAAPAFAGDIPAAGSVTTVAEKVTGMVVACGGRVFTLELAGVGQLVAGSPTQSAGVIHTPLTTTVEDFVGYSPDFGVITAREAAPAIGELAGPANGTGRETEILPMNLTMTVERDPCRPAPRSASPSATVTMDTPIVLESRNLSSFPPPAQGTNPDGSPTGGALYKLERPIVLRVVDGASQKLSTTAES